jgi:hypothetical protein
VTGPPDGRSGRSRGSPNTGGADVVDGNKDEDTGPDQRPAAREAPPVAPRVFIRLTKPISQMTGAERQLLARQTGALLREAVLGDREGLPPLTPEQQAAVAAAVARRTAR